MYDELERTLARELDDVASHLDVPHLPVLPGAAPGPSRWRAAMPLLVAAVVLVALLAVTVTRGGGGRVEPAPAPTTPTETSGDQISTAAPEVPVALDLALYVGGERVPGMWYRAWGRGTHWMALRTDMSWWWGYDATPQSIEGRFDQPPAMSASGEYVATVVIQDGGGWMLVGADTNYAGEGFGGVELEGVASDPAPRAVAMTDDGLVVARGANLQWLWRPLVDGETVDLAKTAPGQVVLGSTAAGLVVNEGSYDSTDGTQGAPYLARLSQDGTFTRVADVPTHDLLDASEEWVAYLPAGTAGGEVTGIDELHVQRIDGSGAGVLAAPRGFFFEPSGFRWETSDRLIAHVVTKGGGVERFVRCRPEPASCVLVDLP